MKHFARDATRLLLFFAAWAVCAACGKVGDPHPPLIRIPTPIVDLNVRQNQDQVILMWTNPSKYVDGSNATDLTDVQILLNGKPIVTKKVSGPGKPQSATLVVTGAAGTSSVYTLGVTTKRNKPSAVSNAAPITIVETPQAAVGLKGAMDQHRIRLDWQPPANHPEFAEIYIVRRSDVAEALGQVKETNFLDMNVEAGKTYSYVIIAARGGEPPVPGVPSVSVAVLAKDETRPAPPTGLQPPVVSDTGAILSWAANTETDIAGYRVYRGDSPESVFTLLDNALHPFPSVNDGGYRPGIYYEVSAVDEDGNESLKSAPVRAP